MTDTDTKIAEHEQNIKSLQHQIDDVRETQKTIAKMSNTLIELTCEIKRTNDSIQRHEKNLEEQNTRICNIERQPSKTLDKIKNAIIAALVSGLAGTIFALIFKN